MAEWQLRQGMPHSMEQPVATNPQHPWPIVASEGKAVKSLYDIAMELCRIRDSLGPVIKGEIRKGRASGSDMILEPGMRKTMLKDAREICERQYARLNTAANLLLEHDKLCRACSKTP